MPCDVRALVPQPIVENESQLYSIVKTIFTPVICGEARRFGFAPERESIGKTYAPLEHTWRTDITVCFGNMCR